MGEIAEGSPPSRDEPDYFLVSDRQASELPIVQYETI